MRERSKGKPNTAEVEEQIANYLYYQDQGWDRYKVASISLPGVRLEPTNPLRVGTCSGTGNAITETGTKSQKAMTLNTANTTEPGTSPTQKTLPRSLRSSINHSKRRSAL